MQSLHRFHTVRRLGVFRQPGSRRGRPRSGSSGGGSGRNPNRRRSNESDDGEVQAAAGDSQPMDEDDSYHYDSGGDDDDSHDLGGNEPGVHGGAAAASSRPPSLSTMFAPPSHLMHRAGGFVGARNFAKDARRWLLVNVQSDSDFACHALNRDVWRDELVENLVREGFILWQAMSSSNEGQTYVTRYKVTGYPHLAIIDPRTGSLLWRKEGWTQVNPLTAEQFVEIASDFCSRHSFDKAPTAARHAYGGGGASLGAAVSQSYSNGSSPAASSSNGNGKRPIHELTEEEQLQAAIRASMQADANDDGDGDGGTAKAEETPTAERGDVATSNENNAGSDDGSKPSAFEQDILSMDVGDEPAPGAGTARVQIRMPDGKRLVRRFGGGSPVKVIYAFVAQQPSVDKPFELKAKFPPQDLLASADDSISSCGLNGEAINVILK